MEFLVFNANSADPDQTQHSAASDLGLHCLPMSHLWDTRLKWVKEAIISLTLVNGKKKLNTKCASKVENTIISESSQ